MLFIFWLLNLQMIPLKIFSPYFRIPTYIVSIGLFIMIAAKVLKKTR